jgi:hypothetical protein
MMAEGHREAARSVIDGAEHGGTLPKTGAYQNEQDSCSTPSGVPPPS